MKRFIVRKDIYYSVQVEAENADEALDQAEKLEIELWDRDDSGYEVEEEE